MLDKKIKNQIKLYNKYQSFFSNLEVVGFPLNRNHSKIKDAVSAFNLLVKNRSKLVKIFKKKKIPYKIYYPKPLYRQYQLKNKIKLKNTEFLCKSIISLLFNDLSVNRFNLIKNKLREIITNNKKFFF